MNEKMNAGIGRFRQKVLAFMRKNHMTDRGDGVLAAVSGRRGFRLPVAAFV